MAGRGLSLKQQKYKKNRIIGMNRLNAARAAGYSESYCLKKSYLLDRVENIGIAEHFERAGLTDKKIVEFALKGLEATRELVVDGKKYGDSPEWQIRHKFFETILKMTGRLNDNSLKDLGNALKPVINIINYGETTASDNDTSIRIPAQSVCVRDFAESGPVQEHSVASTGTKNDSSVK